MRALIAVILAILVIAAPAPANQTGDDDPFEHPTYDPPGDDPVWDGGRDVLWDNGPFETAPGLSVVQDITLGSITCGFNHSVSFDLRVSDDFAIPAGETWNITAITFFAYQTGSSTISTFTDYRVEIWDGRPDLPASSVVWGNLVTNRLASTMWSGVYRVLESDQTATHRPIMVNTCDIVATLGPGTYWLVWQAEGTVFSGPWAPPITIPGVVVTGDGLQYTNSYIWVPACGSGDLGQKGFPFIVEGAMPTPVEPATWGSIKALYQ